MIRHWINGKPWDDTPERLGDVYDPTTGKVAQQVAFASVSEVDAAVAAAAKRLRPGGTRPWRSARR